MTPIITPASLAFERALAALVAYDADGYAACFGNDGVIEWPFATGELPRRIEGRAAIAAHIGSNLARSRAAGRRITGPYDVRLHAVGELLAIAEFTIETGPGSPRVPYIHVYEVAADGRIAVLRDYFGATTQRMADTARAT